MKQEKDIPLQEHNQQEAGGFGPRVKFSFTSGWTGMPVIPATQEAKIRGSWS
jgi:hypothetical protein